MAHHHVKRLPVADDAGRLVGIIGRADLLHVFLPRDLTIRQEIMTDVLARPLGRWTPARAPSRSPTDG